MSECAGPGCRHPEHTDPATMLPWQHQRLPTHAGDRAAAEHAERQAAEHARFRQLFVAK